MSSCALTPRGWGYKNIGGRFTYDEQEQGDCEVAIYVKKRSQKPLNGKYRLRFGVGMVWYAEFRDGKKEGAFRYYDHFRLREASSYQNGLKDGQCITHHRLSLHDKDVGRKKYHFREVTQYRSGRREGKLESYENGVLSTRSQYAEGIKTGEEYWYDEKGIPIDTFAYAYTWAPQQDLTRVYEKYPELENYGFEFRGQITINGTAYLSELDLTLMEIVYKSEECSSREIYLIDTGLDKYLGFFSAGGMPIVFPLEK